MEFHRSAHIDTFTRDNLPPEAEWPVLRFDLADLTYPDRLNCAVTLLDEALAEGHGARIAVFHGDEAWTYGRLAATANRIAHVLTRDLALVPGNRVLLRGANTPWLFACWFAVMKAGLVAVTTMPLLRAVELRQIAAKGRIDVALTEESLAGEVEAAGIIRVVSFGEADSELTHLTAGKPDRFSAVDTAQDDVCLLAFTSGTTGEPKACMHFHRDVIVMADTFCRHILKPGPDDIFTGTPPIGFTFGLGALVVFPFYARAAVALPEKATPGALAAAITRHGATICFTAPTAYRALLSLGTAGFASLRRCVSAGEPLSDVTSEAWFAATGIRIIDGIGATEMIHIFISTPQDEVRPGSTGRPIPGYVAALLDPEGKPIEGPGTGRLAIRGPTGCRYLADPRQRRYVIDGWNVTGDLYRRDADGYYWFQARSDDMILSGGYNIAGPEVERALLGHPAVAECAVIGQPDPERGEIVQAFIVLRDPAEAGPAMVRVLQDHVKQAIAPYKYPRAVTFVDTLPKTPNGKIQRHALRESAPETHSARS